MDFLNNEMDKKGGRLAAGKPRRRETATQNYPERAISVDRRAKDKPEVEKEKKEKSHD